jgi:hypothetical protein
MIYGSAVCEVVRTNELVTNKWTGIHSQSGYIEWNVYSRVCRSTVCCRRW